MDMNVLWAQVQSEAVRYGIMVLGALVMWIVGRWVIGLVGRMIGRALTARHVDATLQQYLVSIISVALNILLVIAILGQFGVQTTSFAAIIAAAGLAIGMAWGGLLANFAAGAFLLILRPFKVGDVISAGGVIGKVDEIGLFATTITTPDGIRTFVGNNKIFGDNIQNLSDVANRRVDRTMQLAHGVNVDDAIARVSSALKNVSDVLETPAPEVFVVDFTLSGPVLAVRPYCKPEHYWSVYSATNDVIRRVGGEAGYPTPDVHYTVHQAQR